MHIIQVLAFCQAKGLGSRLRFVALDMAQSDNSARIDVLTDYPSNLVEDSPHNESFRG